MSFLVGSCTIFLHLLILYLMIHGIVSREIPNTAEHNIDTEAASDHMEPSWNILFHIQDLKVGNNLNLFFSVKKNSSHFIPQQQAESIPFSSSETTKILDLLSFAQDSPQAKAIQQTLHHCELPPLEGETKFCATSLGSMLEKLSLHFGKGVTFRALTTTHLKNWTPRLQKYTIMEEPREIPTGKMFGCHPMPYPYAVFYCHGQQTVTDNRLFMISLEGEDGLKLEAVSICHMDTSQWDPNHASFRLLGIQPGSAPVCHVFPQDNIVWASSPNSIG